LANGPGEVAAKANFLARTLVLIPALNEGVCIGQTVQYWRHLDAAWVRVVNNGSTDDTSQVAARAGAEVMSEGRRGYGAACWTGLLNLPAEADWLLFSSADGSDRLTESDLAAWQRAVENGAELILGDRVSLPDSRRRLKGIQRLGNGLCCGLIYLGWGARFRDMGSLRLVQRPALQRLNLQDRGFGWNVEMQVRAVELGLRWVELPVAYHPRVAGQSKISGSLTGTIRAASGMARMLGRLWWHKVNAPQVAN
jgi:glycosyltransferase involved in cell wall biosynthesis